MSTHKPCRRSLLSISLGLAAAGFACSPAAAGERTALPATATEDYTLLLQTSINQADTGQLTPFVVRQQTLLASPHSLRQLGLRLPPELGAPALIPLSSLAGVSSDYDAARQRINLQVPLSMLDRPPTHRDLRRMDSPRPDPLQRSAGGVLNYDLHARHDGSDTSLSSFSELRLFGLGSGIGSTALAHVFSNGRTHSTRLDSSWQLDWRDAMVSLSVGDSISAAHEWTRALRFGGVRVSRNFSLQPYRLTTPPASFAGEAILPSTVDLYIDGIRQSSQQLPPGRFQLDSNPSLNGAGQARLVVTDITGQSQTLDFALYGTPHLLQAGLADWSLELGAIRRDYGLHSFVYGNHPVASASLRYGLYDSLTLQAHAEGSRGIQQAGAGTVLLLGRRGGVLSGSLAGSRAGKLAGHQYGLGYQWSARQFSISASSLRRSAGYRDVAAVHEQATLPRRSEQAFAGFGTAAGQFSLSYVAQDHPELPRSRYAGVNWSHALSNNAHLSVSVNRDLSDKRGDSAFAYWSQPLDRHTSRSASLRHGRNGNQLSLEANHTASAPAAIGWRAQISSGEQQHGLRAEINQRGLRGQWSAGLEHDRAETRYTQTYASGSGALAWIGGRLHALPRVDDAFVLVSTAGVAEVPVLLDNRSVGSTNKHGQLVVSQLSAWQRNQLSIDPQHLPADMQLDRTSAEVVPETRRGVQVVFPMRRTLALHFGVRDRDGQWLPAGSRISVQASGHLPTSSVVGHEGKLYLLDPPPQSRLHFADGQCSAHLPVAPASEGRINLEDVICE